MSSLLLLTNALQPSGEVLPALGLLMHAVKIAPAEASALLEAPPADVILVDGRRDLPQVRSLCRVLRTTGLDCPLVLVLTEGGMAAISADWGVDDVIVDSASPAEVEARLRLAIGKLSTTTGGDDTPPEIRTGELSIDEATYTARLRGRVLDLTFKEFELLKYLAQHPGRVFTRAQLLQEVWGYDYFGGTRTVDVHVRRLRAKLGPEHEALIGTVRNVGYRFVLPEKALERDSKGLTPALEDDDEPDDFDDTMVPPDGRGALGGIEVDGIEVDGMEVDRMEVDRMNVSGMDMGSAVDGLRHSSQT